MFYNIIEGERYFWSLIISTLSPVSQQVDGTMSSPAVPQRSSSQIPLTSSDASDFQPDTSPAVPPGGRRGKSAGYRWNQTDRKKLKVCRFYDC